MTDEFSTENSPLAEADADSITNLINRINDHLIASVPERITDEDCLSLATHFRREAENWTLAEAEKPKRRKKPAIERNYDL